MNDQALFMTGGSGFIGKRLLKSYLQRDMRIILLVQPEFLEPTKKFLNESRQNTKALVELVIGDIVSPNLGLNPLDFQKILTETTQVLHIAAAYSLELKREIGLRVNVLGTENVLNVLEKMPHLRQFGYMSTTAISGAHTGRFSEEAFDVGQRFKNFYEETKFMAEKKVRERMKLIPTTIFRPTIVVGDSRTGEMEKIDGPYYGFMMIKRNLHFMFQKSSAKCHIEPVDFVTRGIEYLMDSSEAIGRTIHLADPHPLTYDEFFDLVFERWKTFKPLLRIPARAMYPFFFIPGIKSLFGVPRQSFVYTMTPIDYGTEEMQRLLDPAGILCPPVSSYIDVMISYFRKFLKPSNPPLDELVRLD